MTPKSEGEKRAKQAGQGVSSVYVMAGEMPLEYDQSAYLLVFFMDHHVVV